MCHLHAYEWALLIFVFLCAYLRCASRSAADRRHRRPPSPPLDPNHSSSMPLTHIIFCLQFSVFSFSFWVTRLSSSAAQSLDSHCFSLLASFHDHWNQLCCCCAPHHTWALWHLLFLLSLHLTGSHTQFYVFIPCFFFISSTHIWATDQSIEHSSVSMMLMWSVEHNP